MMMIQQPNCQQRDHSNRYNMNCINLYWSLLDVCLRYWFVDPVNKM